MGDEYDVMQSLLTDRPVAFHPMMARVLGGIHEALFFQQIAYWSGKGRSPHWIYRAASQIVDSEQTSSSKVAKPSRLPSTDQIADSEQTTKSTSERTKEDEMPEPKLPKTLEELEAWERKMEERRRWIKGIERSAD